MTRERTPAATLGAYGAALALVFVSALGVGRAVGPLDGASAPDQPGTHSTGSHETVSHDTGTSGQDR